MSGALLSLALDPYAFLKRRIDQYSKTHLHGFIVDKRYKQGATGQRYAFLITKGVWYKIRLFVENDLPTGTDQTVDVGLHTSNTSRLSTTTAVYEVLKTKEELTLKRAEQYMSTIDELFQEPTISKVYNLLRICPMCFPAPIPDGALLHPLYFERGQVILRQEEGVFYRGAIYIGNAKVIEFHNGKVVEESLEQFAGGEATCQLFTLNFIVSVRSSDTIASQAIHVLDDVKRNPRINAIYGHWTAFISICTTGVNFALGA